MTASNHDLALVAHLVRRAGFGASRAELEELAERGYDAVLDELMDPEAQPDIDEDTLYRYMPMIEVPNTSNHAQMKWLYWMTNTRKPLQEKVALFWHQVFATGNTKVESHTDMLLQIKTFREHGMGNFRDLLVRLARDPAMLYWLDNNENHKRAPNENWGRELLELFAMGVGGYTEKDVYECSRAFTGWTMGDKIPGRSLGPLAVALPLQGRGPRLHGQDLPGPYRELQRRGRDRHHRPTAAVRHLHLQAPLQLLRGRRAPGPPPGPSSRLGDPEAVKAIADSLIESGFEMKAALRTIFTSDFFKNAVYRRVRNPVEVFVNTLKVTGDMLEPDPRWIRDERRAGLHGADSARPADRRGLAHRLGVGQQRLPDQQGQLRRRPRQQPRPAPAVRDIIDRVSDNGATISAERFSSTGALT